MNDITALAQRVKTEASAIDDTQWYLAKPSEIRALAEALEKAQRENRYLREQSAEWERKAISNFQECAKMSERIYLLESRTVTVTLPSLKQTESGERYVWSYGIFNYKNDVIEILRAAGIQVIEGEQNNG